MSMRRVRRACAWLTTAGLLLGGTAIASANREAGSSQPAQQQQQQQKQQKQQPMTQRATQRDLTVSGRVVATKSVRLKGTNERHLVALIRTSAGQRRVVDLGPRRGADKLELTVGDRLTARGRGAQIGDRKILIANQARTPERSIMINRSMQRMQFDRAVRQAHQGQSCPPNRG